MPAPKSKKKVLKYSQREELTAVRLGEAPGVKVKDVAAALDIHPFMLSRWRKEAREGRLARRRWRSRNARAGATRSRSPKRLSQLK